MSLFTDTWQKRPASFSFELCFEFKLLKISLQVVLAVTRFGQTKNGFALPINFSTQESIFTQEPPWLWFTLPELGFPLLTDEYRRPIHPEIEEYMRRYVSNDQDWEQVTCTCNTKLCCVMRQMGTKLCCVMWQMGIFAHACRLIVATPQVSFKARHTFTGTC